MSELKGILLAIVLAVSAFTVIYPLVVKAMKDNTTNIAQRMKDAAEYEPEYTATVNRSYSLHY